MRKNKIKEKIDDMLCTPKIYIDGDQNIFIENHRGIVKLREDIILLKSFDGMLEINGKQLVVNEITADFIAVTGQLECFKYIRGEEDAVN